MARIVSLGSALQDVYLIDHDDLAPTEIGDKAIFGKVLVGSKVEIDKISFEVGGGGIKSAITFARYGHETIFMGHIADDAAGDAGMRVLDREEVDNSYVNYLEGKATGTSVILLDSKSGERTVLTCRGASEKFNNFDPNDLERIHPDWLYVTTLHGDMDTLLKFFEKAHEVGAKVMFNPGVKELEKRQKLIGLLNDVDVLLMNKSEAAQLVPGNILTEILYHLNAYVPIAIVTDGAMGGIAGDYRTKEAYRFGIYEDVPVRDATGAGDAFGSGFLAAYASGANLEEALTFASANSTSVVRKIGANAGILTGHEELHMMPMQKI